MPCVVFLKYLKITGTGEDSHDKVEYSECKEVKKEIAEKYNMSASAVERQLHRSHEKLLREQLNYPCPIMLGLDEHSIHRGNTKGHKFAVTLTGLRNHRVYEGFEGKEGCRGGAGLSIQMETTAPTNGISTTGSAKPNTTGSTRCLSGCCFEVAKSRCFVMKQRLCFQFNVKEGGLRQAYDLPWHFTCDGDGLQD